MTTKAAYRTPRVEVNVLWVLLAVWGLVSVQVLDAGAGGISFAGHCGGLRRPGPDAAGRQLCWSRPKQQLMVWNGARWVPADTTALGIINPKAYGAKGDVIWDKTCTITARSNTLVCRSGQFKQADVGKTILVPQAGAGHPAPVAPTVTLMTDSTTGQMTAGNHRYKFVRVFASGTTAAGNASAAVTNDGTHTSNKIHSADCYGQRGCILLRIYRNSISKPNTYRFLSDFQTSDTYYDTVPDSAIAGNPVAPSSDSSFAPLLTTIGAYTSATTVILAASATTTSKQQQFTKWGTDDTAALRQVNEAVRSGSVVFFPPGRYWFKVAPAYTLDEATADHNGSGDIIVQVKETIDAGTFSSGKTVCVAANSATQVMNCSTISSVLGNRFTITPALSQDFHENDYVFLSGATLFDLKLGPEAKNDTHWVGHKASLEWMPESTGWLWGPTDARNPEIERFNFIGSSRVGHPPEQHVFTSGAGSGSVSGGKLHDVYAEGLWQLLFWGIQNNDWEVYKFTCYWVLACTQSAGASGTSNAKSRMHQHHFSIYGDPLGTDDAVAVFGDAYDVEIGPGLIDKGFTGQLWNAHYSGNGITIATVGSGSIISGIKVHDVTIRNGGGILYGSGKPIDPRYLNPNKSGIVADTTQGGSINQLTLNNVTIDKAFYCFFLYGPANSFSGTRLTGLTAKNCGAAGFRLSGHGSAQAQRLKIVNHSQWYPIGGFTHENMTDFQYRNINIDGSGSAAGAAGFFNGMGLSGTMREIRSKKNAQTGFWMANNDVTGPITIDDVVSEKNGSYGYEFQGASASKGFHASNLRGQHNGVALFRDGIVPPNQP